MRWWGALVGGLAIGGTAAAQPIVTVGAPLYQTAAEFTDVSTVRLFGDGSMLVADPGAREFVRVTGRGRERTVLGRHGSGPGEYESAQHLIAMPNGLTALIDPPQNRWMLFDSTGAFQRTRVFGPSEHVLRYAEYADARGNAYGLGFPAPPPAKPERALMRWTAATGRLDTLAVVAGADMVASPMPAGPSGRPAGVAYFFVPFAPQDAWAVGPDGSLVVARAESERLEWRDANGRITATTRLPAVARFPVSDSARSVETRAAVREKIPRWQPLWTENGLRVPRPGTAWLRRTRAPGEPFTEYLELAPSGTSRRIRFPGRSRIVGYTGNRVVVARRTEDDLQQLEVYVIPGFETAASK
ncbi:MAG: hypothetical protein K2R93_09140 [Gemmatimonadaceae bacterium]|nr:hypothetical protein [Gemmatimonadaceae bacterium]